MKTIGTRDFTRYFNQHRHDTCVVKDRNQVIGTWTPAPINPEAVDFEARVREDFNRKLPFTFTQLLKAGKKRF